MDPGPGGRADGSLDDVDERGNVVVGDRFAIAHRLHEGVVDRGGVRPTGGRIDCGHDAQCGVRVGGEQLDLQVAVEAGDVAEDVGHLRQRVARDHCHTT